jgi:hypothetical protein
MIIQSDVCVWDVDEVVLMVIRHFGLDIASRIKKREIRNAHAVFFFWSEI